MAASPYTLRPSFETLAEPVIGPRFARTRWQAPQDEARISSQALRRREAPSRRMKPPPCLPQLEQRLQEFAHRLAGFFGGRGIAADMRVELDARILVAEGCLRIGIDQHAAFAFLDMTMA